VVSFEPSANGIVNMAADGSFTFTPDAGYTGTETLTYTITDGVATVSGTYTLAVTNADPMANADSYSVHAGEVLTIPAGTGLLSNDTDADGDPLSVVSFEPSANGIVNMAADGSFTFTPDAGYTGTETLTYTITDGVATVSGTYTLAVTNTDPVANDDTYSATAGEVLTVDAATGLLSNDTDADGDPLSVFSVVPPSNGVLNASADGSFTYTPDGGFTGTDTFTYRIVDGAGSDTATVTINVGAVPPSNDAPGLEAGANVTVNEGDTVMRTLALTDSDTETRSFSVDWGDGTVETFDSGLTNPQIQHLFLADGTFTVNVMVDDNAGASNSTETDSFQVTVLNLPPVAGDDSGAVSEDGPAVTLGSPLFNDTDPGLDPLTLIEFAGVLETDGGFFDTAHLLPSGALLTFTSGGEFIYDPNGAYEGLSTGDSTTDSFTYTISDDDGATDTATVTVTINGVNDDPVAGADSAVTPQNTPVDIDVLANDSDAETFSSLSIASVGAASNGTVAIDDNGTAGDASDDFVTYTPNGGFTGTDSFTYTLMDSDGGTDVGSVTVMVGANPDEYLVGTNGPDTIDGMNGNDTILGRNGNDLLIGGTGNDRLFGQGGSDTMIGGDGNDFIRTAGGDLLVFDMNDGDDKVKGFDTSMDLIQLSDGGTASFVYDAGQNRTTMTYGATIVTFFGANVTAASVLTAGAPVATDDIASTLETLPVAIDVLANDSDPDGDPLEITGYTNGANGTVVLDTKGTADTTDDVLVYTANGGFTGTDTFTYDISDGTNTASATVQVMVTAPIVGTGGPDMLIGTDGIDSISGRGGDDTLIGLGGDDTLRGDGGNDVIRGDAGNEFIHGGHGDDLLDGSDGADTLVGSAGADTLQGGDGDDNLFGGADDDRLLGEAGNDRLVGGAGMDHMTGGTGDDTIIAEGGDTLVFNLADGNDLVNDFTSGLDMVVLAEGGTYTLTTDAVLNRSIIDYGSTQITFMDEILTMADITVL
jgi:Ca2+-binding RTX toxin-like protein